MPKQHARESSLAELIREHKTSAVETPERLDTQELKPLAAAKSRDASYIKLTAYVPRQLHARLKSKAALEQREISDVVVELVEGYVKEGSEVR